MNQQDANDESGLFQRASIYLVANVANAALPFLLLPFLVRALGPADYGTVGLFTSAMGFLSVGVGLGGVGYARTRYYKHGPEEYRSVLGAVLLIFAATAALLGLLLWGTQLGGWSTAHLPMPVLGLALLGAASQFGFSLRLALWQMAERPAPYSATLLAATALNLCLSIGLVFGLGMGWEGRAYGIALPLLVLGGGSLLALFRSGGVSFEGAVGRIPQLLFYCLPLVPHALARSAIPFFERTALAGNTGLAEAGVYFLAFQLALPVRILANSLDLALKPWGYKRMAAEDRAGAVRGSYAVMGVLTLAALAYAGVVHLAYDWVAGPEMAAGKPATLWLIASGLLSGCYLVVVKGLIFAEKTRALMWVTLPLSVAYCVAVFSLDDSTRVAQLNALYQGLLFVAVWFVGNRIYPQPWFGAKP